MSGNRKGYETSVFLELGQAVSHLDFKVLIKPFPLDFQDSYTTVDWILEECEN
jgi:hypothetical protein